MDVFKGPVVKCKATMPSFLSLNLTKATNSTVLVQVAEACALDSVLELHEHINTKIYIQTIATTMFDKFNIVHPTHSHSSYK